MSFRLKFVLVLQGINRALGRGEILESLITKSDELSRSSQRFEHEAHKFNKDSYFTDVRA